MSEFAARRAPRRARSRQRVAREVGAAVRWLVWGLGPWGGLEEPLPVMVGRVGVVKVVQPFGSILYLIHTIRSKDTHNQKIQREVLRRSINMQSVHD